MENIFYNKKTSVLFVAATLLVVVLLCLLLVNLTQMSTFNQREKQINSLIEQAKQGVIDAKELEEYRQTNEYIIQWALENGRIHEDNLSWIEENTDWNK